MFIKFIKYMLSYPTGVRCCRQNFRLAAKKKIDMLISPGENK